MSGRKAAVKVGQVTLLAMATQATAETARAVGLEVV
jgi:hypothetical protein